MEKKYKKVIALLPMKGNSQRIPKKNLKKLDGKPLYHYILKSLINSSYIKKIIINTDCKNITKNIKDNFSEKVEINKRPKELIGDMIPMNDIISYDINKIKENYFIQTHSTNPLLKTSTINKAIKSFFNNKKKFDSLFSVNKIQTRLYFKSLKPINHNPKKLERTQDLKPVYEENSNLYIFSKNSFKRANNNRIGLKPNLFEINKLESIDIDDYEDFILVKNLKKGNFR